MSSNFSSTFGDTVQSYSLPFRANAEENVAGGYTKHILICTDTRSDGCYHKGAGAVKDEMYSELNSRGMDRYKLSAVRSLGYCDQGPIVVVYPDDVWYAGVTEEDVDEIVESHLDNDEPVEDLQFDPALPEEFNLFVVCTFLSACGPLGGGGVLKEMMNHARDTPDTKVVQSYGCLKECSMGPVCCKYPDGDWYAGVSESTVEDVWTDAIDTGGESVKGYVGRIGDV